MKHPYPENPSTLPKPPKLSTDLRRTTIEDQNPLNWKKEIRVNFLQNEDGRTPSGHENISTSLVLYNLANHTTGGVGRKQKGLRDTLFKHIITDDVKESVGKFLVASEEERNDFNFLNNLKYDESDEGCVLITSDTIFVVSTSALNQDPLVESWHFNVRQNDHAKIAKKMGNANVPAFIKTCGVKMTTTTKIGEADQKIVLDLVMAITPEPHLLSGKLSEVDHSILFGEHIKDRKFASSLAIGGKTKTQFSNSSLVIFEQDVTKYEVLLEIHSELQEGAKNSTTLEELVIAADKARARYEDELACLIVTFHEAFQDANGRVMYGLEAGKQQLDLVNLEERQAVSSCSLSRIFSLLCLDESARSISTGSKYPLGALIRRFKSLTDIKEIREFFLKDAGVSIEFRSADLSSFREDFGAIMGATDGPAQVAGNAFTHLLRLAAVVYKTNTWVISDEDSNLSGLGIIRRVLRRMSGASSMYISWKHGGIESALERLGGQDKGASPFTITCGPHNVNTATLFHVCVNATGPLHDLIGNLPVATQTRDKTTLFVAASTGSRLINQFSLSSTASNLLTMIKIVSGYFATNPEHGLASAWKFDEEGSAKTRFAISSIRNSASTLSGAKKMIQKILNSHYIRFPSIKDAASTESDNELVDDKVDKFLQSVFSQTMVSNQFNRNSDVLYLSSGVFENEHTVIDFPDEGDWSDKRHQITSVIIVGGHKLVKLEEFAVELADKIDDGLEAFKGSFKNVDKTIRIMVTTTSTASGEKKDVYDITNVFNAPLNNIEGLIQSDDDAWSVLAVLNALLASLRFLTGAGKEVSLITCCICQNLAALPTLAAENNKNNKVFPWMLVSNVSRTVHYGVITRLAVVNTSALGGAKKEEVPAEPRPLPIIQEQN